MQEKSVDGKQFRFGVIPKMKNGISAKEKKEPDGMNDLEELVLYDTDFERAVIVGYQMCKQFDIDPEKVQVIIPLEVDGNE